MPDNTAMNMHFFGYTYESAGGTVAVTVPTRSIALQMAACFARLERLQERWFDIGRKVWRMVEPGNADGEFASFVRVPARLRRRDRSAEKAYGDQYDRWLDLTAKHGVETFMRTGPAPGDLEVFCSCFIASLRQALHHSATR